MKPVTAKIDINQPALAMFILNASIKTGMMGGTLNWLSGAATLAKNTTTKITQA